MATYRRLLNALGNSMSHYFNYSTARNRLLVCQPCATFKSRAIEKKLGIPPRPKRPMTPFIVYVVSERPRIAKENPGLPPIEIMKKLAEGWKTFDSTQKEELKKTYMKELEEYSKQMMTYEQNLTDEQKRSIKAEKFREIEASEKQKMKSRLRELGKPKKPPTMFILFMLSRAHTKNKGMKFSDWLSIAAKEWNEAPADVKAKFENETKKLMEEYKKEMINWEEKMIKLGHIDVVRKQVLMELKGKSMSNKKL
ncbi:transcription factor A, mitochondrial isoform X2 [Diachasma alloeum]|uniref:transcription factor A, mitochondrial isoform X2 n=1 Tax=Diachasma alloeum TaxID=454923 RepID=UPI000738424C|nr:transcription factor A, mitochondrial isoform X2 [Diachasma alloeum]